MLGKLTALAGMVFGGLTGFGPGVRPRVTIDCQPPPPPATQQGTAVGGEQPSQAASHVSMFDVVTIRSCTIKVLKQGCIEDPNPITGVHPVEPDLTQPVP